MKPWIPVACILAFPAIPGGQSLTPASTPLQSTSDTERNKALILRYYDEVWHRNNFVFADSVFAPDYVRHDGSSPADGPGEAPLQSAIAKEKKRYLSDLRFHHDVILAEEDIVAVRWTSTAETMGIASIIRALVGKRGPIVSTGVNLYRIRDGRVVELWNNRDDLTTLREGGTFRWYAIGGVVVGILITLLGSAGRRRWSRTRPMVRHTP